MGTQSRRVPRESTFFGFSCFEGAVLSCRSKAPSGLGTDRNRLELIPELTACPGLKDVTLPEAMVAGDLIPAARKRFQPPQLVLAQSLGYGCAAVYCCLHVWEDCTVP